MRYSRIIQSFAIAGVLAAPTASAQSTRTRPDSLTPFLFISYYMSSNLRDGVRMVDTLRLILKRRASDHDLYVIPQSIVDANLTSGDTPSTIADLVELGKQMRADAILDLGVSRTVSGTDSGFVLTPMLLRRHQEPVALPVFDAPTIRRAAEILARWVLSDSSLKRRR